MHALSQALRQKQGRTLYKLKVVNTQKANKKPPKGGFLFQSLEKIIC